MNRKDNDRKEGRQKSKKRKIRNTALRQRKAKQAEKRKLTAGVKAMIDSQFVALKHLW